MRVKVAGLELTGVSAREWAQGMKMNGSRVVQPVPRLLAKGIDPLDRGNVTTTLQFTVSREWPSLVEAQTWLAKHEAALAVLPRGACVLMFTGGEEGKFFYLPNAVLSAWNGDAEGVRTIVAYTVIGGVLSATGSVI